ncbi:hypothetical protein YA0089_27185 [Pseudomonas viridiflava]|uniref:hypothetical protein n=1 Tax=Pseudomonas viridiflava TaxID=33069 RepID=UPI0018E5AC22|nr:hypothetical protein [Pseudomonas viridiflava]MBI6727303.1 hypothetical protein [Pseudomonas viridiflava]
MSPELIGLWDKLNLRATGVQLTQAASLSEAMRKLEEARALFEAQFIKEAREAIMKQSQ